MKKTVEVYVRGRVKKRYLPEPMADEWEREDAQIFSQNLNSLKQKVQDVVMHTSTVKEMCECPGELYSGSNILNKAYNVV